MFDNYGKQDVAPTIDYNAQGFSSLVGMLSTRKGYEQRRQFTIMFKRGVVLAYLHTKISARQISDEFELSSAQLVYNWTNQFKRGELEVGNAIAVSRTPGRARR